MPCSNCGNGRSLGPSESNGGEYILRYIGDELQITEFGAVTGGMYVFGTKKRDFFANYKDVVGLFQSEHGTDLRAVIR